MSISIIVPMFNAEKTIQRLLDSICNQTFTQFNVLLVDDGSTDDTFKQIQKYIEQDSRFSYYYKENGGVSSARNYGLSLSENDYIAFLDSDDYVHHQFLELMVAGYLAEGDIDLVTCSFEKDGLPHLLEEKTVSNEYAIYNLTDKDGPMGYVCNKLFKRSIIKENKIEFNQSVHYGEDLLFCIRYLLQTRKVRYVPEILFYYVFNEDSKSANLKSAKTLTHINSLEMIFGLLKANKMSDKIIVKYKKIYYRITIGYLFKHNFSLSNENFNQFDLFIQQIDYNNINNPFLLGKILLGRAYVIIHKLVKKYVIK